VHPHGQLHSIAYVSVKVVWLTYITLHYRTGPDVVFLDSYMVTGWWLSVKLEELKVLPTL
jgi:hypothetical protein